MKVFGGVALTALVLFGAPTRAEEGATIPFAIDWEDATGSRIDLSGFLEAPAGKDGFLRIEGSHIVRPDGRRFRVWGVNVCGPQCCPPKEQAPLIAADLARYGVNCVRFHHMDSTWGKIFGQGNTTRQLDPEQLDRLDFFVAELKKRGIFTNLNLNVSRHFRAGDEVRDWKLLGYGKGATYFNRRLIDLQKEYATQLLTHANPYTGQEYRHEPAVAVVEMVNENALVEAWISYRLVGEDRKDAGGTWSPIPPSYAEELTEQYNAWLKEKLAPAELAQVRAEAGVSEGQPVPRLQQHDFAKASRLRFHSEAKFLMELEQRFFEEMRDHLQQLGVRALLVGSSDHNDGISGYPHIQANLVFDIVDGHGYWQHPRMEPFWIQNTPMVDDPLDSTVVQFARTPVVDRPFTISETNHPFPAEYASEGIPILTAYALLHDWDGIYWFSFGQPRTEPWPLGWFDFGNDPVKMSQLASCGLMFHRQDVRPARQTVVRPYDADTIIESIRLPRAERPFFTPGFARSTPLEHATRWMIGKPPGSDFPPPAGDTITADTGEIVWRHPPGQGGLVTLETPRSQMLVGFARKHDVSLSNLALDVENEFCAVVCTSLDTEPIERAGRLLLTLGGPVANSGLKWNDDRKTLAERGKYPPVIAPLRGAVVLRKLAGATAVSAQPLTAEGRPLGPAFQAVRQGDLWRIPLGEPATVWQLLEVTR